MRKPNQLTRLLAVLTVSVMSSSAFAEASNCHSYWPKVPYNCVMVKVADYPTERADFSAFETGPGNSVDGSRKSAANHAQYSLRSVSRATARKLQAQREEASD